MTLAVNAPNEAIDALRKQWAVLEALQGGTPAMRQKKALLPQWPAEEGGAYLARLSTATLFPAYRRTVGVMSGKPFAKALAAEGVPQPWLDDADLQGVSLHSFCAEMFEETFYGLAGILVDYPRVEPGRAPRTVAQVERTGARPYLVRVRHDQILGWKTAVVGGRMQLSQLRLTETVEVDDGEYGTKPIEQVRVLRPGSWELWRQSDGNNKAWILYDAGTTTLKVVPFVPLYGRRRAYMIGDPPLLDLAYLNVKHWQSQSDQDTILHAARVPILSIAGMDETPELIVGGSMAVNLGNNPDAKLVWVEHSGAAIGAGEESLRALEEQMIQTGAELLVKKPGDRSATESSNDAEANKSDLQRMAENFEDAIDQALHLMAQFAGTGQGGSVQLFSDYGAATLSDASASLIKELNGAGLLSKGTTIEELKRRGVLSAEVDAEEEAAKVAEEGPPLGMMGEFGLGPDGKPLPKDDEDEAEKA